MSELAHDVFDNDDRAVDDQSEINRAQTHQVAGDAEAFNMPVSANRNESGIAAATMSAARQLPNNANKHDDHENRALEQIVLHGVDRVVDQNASGRIESESPRLRAASSEFRRDALFTRSATSRLFSPASIIVVPMTVSWPSIVAAPVRNLDPYFTSATIFDEQRLYARPEFQRQIADVLELCSRA